MEYHLMNPERLIAMEPEKTMVMKHRKAEYSEKRQFWAGSCTGERRWRITDCRGNGIPSPDALRCVDSVPATDGLSPVR